MSNTGICALGFLQARFPQAEVLGLLRKMQTPRMCVLANTFSSNYRPLKTYLRMEKQKTLQLYLLSGPSLRNKRLYDYDVLFGETKETFRKKLLRKNPRLTSKLNKYCKSLSKIISSVPQNGTSLFICPDLETDLCPDSFRILSDLTRPHFPSAQIVYNPVGSNRFNTRPLPGYVYELHEFGLDVPGQFVASNDGTDIKFGNLRPLLNPFIEERELPGYISKSRDAVANYIWCGPMNLLKPGAFVDPRKRTNTLTRAHIAALEKYLL